jgi:hypothetical protein
MKVLLDENLPHDLRHELIGHDVFTVQYLGWSGLKNGELLPRAGASGFDALLTMDSGVPYQQNIAALPLTVIVLKAASNDLDDLRPLVPRLLEALNKVTARTLLRVS